MRSIPKLLFLLIPLVLLIGCGDDDDPGPQINLNTAWWEVVPPPAGKAATVGPGEEVTLRLMIHNSVPIAGVEMPFVPSSIDCSVVDDETDITILAPFANWLLVFKNWDDDDSNRCCPLTANHPSLPPVEAGDHAFLEVTFTISAEAEAQTITVDACSFIGSIPIIEGEALHTASFATVDGNTIMVEFTPGEIVVVAPK